MAASKLPSSMAIKMRLSAGALAAGRRYDKVLAAGCGRKSAIVHIAASPRWSTVSSDYAFAPELSVPLGTKLMEDVHNWKSIWRYLGG